MKLNSSFKFLSGIAAVVLSLTGGAGLGKAAPLHASGGGLFGPPSAPLRLPFDPTDPQQVRWMKWASAEIQAVHVGMTRFQMAGVLERAGGAYAARATAPLTGVYSLRQCPYFKVSVEFAPVRKPQRDKYGSVWTPEDPKDVITKISKPRLEQVYYD